MSLTISLQFPTGRYVAATMSRRDEVEWPPHPARFVLGLLSAHHRGGTIAGERAALQWLCEQPAPEVIYPAASEAAEEVIKGVYVPQNPAVARDVKAVRKAREFACVLLDADQPTVYYHWPQAQASGETKTELQGLLQRLPRLGHSSSLVMAQVAEGLPPETGVHLRPVTADSFQTPEMRLRVPWPGLIDSAEIAFDAEGRQRELEAAFQAVEKARRPLTSFPASSRGRYDARHVTCGYARSSSKVVALSPWEDGILILKRSGGTHMGLESTWQITQALHRTLLDHWGKHTEWGGVPAWISGHGPRPDPSQSGPPARHCHLAFFPLAHVGREHASGHLLGLGLAFPRPDKEQPGLDKNTILRQWGQLMDALFKTGTLKLAPADGAWHLELQPGSELQPPWALQPSRWTTPQQTWKSVTPIILDRHPKPRVEKDPLAWNASCQKIIREACLRQGLPEPTRIDVNPCSTLEGVPPAPAFAAPRPRPGQPPRFHIHATVEFPEKVMGPLLLGAGRYRGYGLMLPVSPDKKTHENSAA